MCACQLVFVLGARGSEGPVEAAARHFGQVRIHERKIWSLKLRMNAEFVFVPTHFLADLITHQTFVLPRLPLGPGSTSWALRTSARAPILGKGWVWSGKICDVLQPVKRGTCVPAEPVCPQEILRIFPPPLGATRPWVVPEFPVACGGAGSKASRSHEATRTSSIWWSSFT